MNERDPPESTEVAEAARRLLQDVAEVVGDAIVCASMEGKIQFMNREARQVFGYSNAEIIDQPVSRLVPRRFLAKHTNGFAEWTKDKSRTMPSARKTVEAVCKDGKEVTIQLTLNELRLGGYDYVVALMRDITEQEASRKSLRLLQAAFKAAAHSTVVATIDGLIVWVNPAFTKMTGYSAKEAIGAKTNLLKSGEQDATYYANLWQTILAGKTWNGTLINRRKDGVVYLEKQAITPVLSDSGAVEYFIAVKEDVTETIQTQQELRKTHDRYRRLFESSPLALYEENYSAVKAFIDDLRSSGVNDLRAYCDEHPDAITSCASMIEIVDVNKAAVEMAGAGSKQELLGDLTRIFDEESYDDLREQLLWLHEGNLSYAAEVVNKTLTGERRIIELSLSIAPEFAESWSEVIISLTDITERKQRERQLAHSIKMEAVGRLTSGIAHDFNNVLTVISGNLRLISDMSGHEMGDETREMIDDVLSAADDGAQLTARLLAFSRQPTSKSRQLDLEEVIEDFAELMRRTLGSSIDVSTQIAGDLTRMVGDESAIGNVLLNLSLNARDAMQEGGMLKFTAAEGVIPVDAGEDQGLESVPCIIIEVIDSGIGMDADVLEFAIEPFFTTKPIDEGNGLGLSMVQDFVNECDGRLTITSAPGDGTTITLYLPTGPADPDEL